MHLSIYRTVIRLLINDEAFGASLDNWRVILGIHWTELNGNRRKIRSESAHALNEIIAVHKLRMLTGDEKDLAKSLLREIPRFGHNFIYAECDAQNRIIPRKTAILTIVDAFVGKIERRKEAHGSAKILQCERVRSLRHSFEFLSGFRGDQILKALDEVRFFQSEAVQCLDK